MQKYFGTPIEGYLEKISLRDVCILLVIIIAILSRLIGLGDRVMSHDEVNHVVPAFDLFSGRGYRHDPVTHGPLQFHLMGLSYFLFGDNDFTSRLPHALFSIATIIFVMIFFRRYLGSFGSFAAGVLFTISPFMLFYGRYARNDVICVFLGLTAIYSFLRFYETREMKHLYYLAVSLALNFSAKETAYIFAAQLLVFVLILFIYDLLKINWVNKKKMVEIFFFNGLFILTTILALAISVLLFRNSYMLAQGSGIAINIQPGSTNTLVDLFNNALPMFRFVIPGTIPLLVLSSAIIFMRRKLRWDLIRKSSSFSLLISIGTLVLPLLAPFLVRFAGMDPASYSDPFVVIADYIFIGVLFFISYGVGSEWDRENWWKLALLFFGIYAILYSTFFTNTTGLVTGLVGSLGHWLNQQSVQRGGQPSYYYAFFLLPIYEFLAIFGSIFALYFGIKHKSFWRKSTIVSDRPIEEDEEIINGDQESQPAPILKFKEENLVPSPAIFIYLIITSLIAFTIAGEKMPWLSLHIIFPLLLTASWAFEQIYTRFRTVWKKKNLIRILATFSILLNTIFIVLQLLGNTPPFQNQTQADLQSTYRFIFLSLIEIGLITFFIKKKNEWNTNRFLIILTVTFLLLLSLLTVRSAYRASFINYDNAKEFLVYAHAADGPKLILEQVEEISQRTTNGLDIKVAYDNHGLYPFWWYLRHYPNKIVYLENPTRSLEEAPLIIAGQDKYAKLDPIVRDNYYFFEYMRLWWPMQDYWNMNWEKLSAVIGNKEMRQAIFNIWLDRDYTLYAQAKNNQNLTLETWLPSEKTRLYIRKDIAAQMWQYSTAESLQQTVEADPYAEKMISKLPDGFIGMGGDVPGELNGPRGIDIAPDGTIYVADSRNHRIQVFSSDGLLLNVWGSFANALDGDAPGGTFNEPWDVAVAADGAVYVADTFNHRIQKFDANGRFLKMWGIFAQGQDPESFWGPRGIEIDAKGNVLVADTGNKRVVVFDADLEYITQFGGGGFDLGQFDEPVGIAVSNNGDVIVADTWNRRVQIFSADAAGTAYSPKTSFDIDGWFGQGIDNKPYITADLIGNIYISDPEGGRILVFNPAGDFLIGYQDINNSSDLIAYPFGLAVDTQGRIWFSDASANVISFIDGNVQGLSEKFDTFSEPAED